MSTPYPPSSDQPQQPGQAGPPAGSGQPAGSHPGQTGGYQQPGAQGYGSYPGYGQQQPTQQWNTGQQPQAPWGGGNAASGGRASKNFFAKLFDLSFSEFITPQVVKVLYILAMVFVGLAWIGYSILAFTQNAAAGLFVLLIVGPLYALFVLIVVRLSVEFYIAVIRIAEDVRILKTKSESA